VRETFQLTQSAGSLGLPAGVQFDVDDLQRQYKAAIIGTTLDGTEDDTAEAGVVTAAPSYVGINDFSQGYLRRSVLDPRYISE
jgi:hypothetical protein